MEKVLNQEEIDAMVRQARTQNGASGQVGPTITSWDIRQAGQVSREQMRLLSGLLEAFARNLTDCLGAYLRVEFKAGFVSAEHLVYRDFLQRLPEVTYVASCKVLPAGITAVLQLDLALAYPLVDVLLGGEGGGAAPARDITEIEEQILESIGRIICRELQLVWRSLGVEFAFEKRHEAAQARQLMAAEEKNLSLSFELTMLNARGTLNIAIPAVLSNALLRKLASDWGYHQPARVSDSRAALQRRLLDCQFRADLEVTAIRVPVHELTGLEPGMVLRLKHPADSLASLFLAGTEMLQVRLARSGNFRVAQVVDWLPQAAERSSS